MKSWLLGEDGKLRFIWRAAIFYGLTFWALPWLLNPLIGKVFVALHLATGLTAALIAFVEAQYFIIALIPTLLFALYERRSPLSYGLMLSRAFDAPTWEGLAAGIVMPGAVALGMLALGGMQLHGLATTGSALALSLLGWIGANICVGIAEEFWFRHYFLNSLWRSLGFWPASLIVAAVFAAIHYFNKPGENVSDVISLVAFSMMLCYSVLRTGALWFAVGLHAAFDFMQLVVIGTPNGGQLPVGRVFDTTFHGPAWLTGGTLGTEASWLMYPMFAVVWLYIHLRYRPAKATLSAPP
jgi:membrane protease YdiL (CAAX protease family)